MRTSVGVLSAALIYSLFLAGPASADQRLDLANKIQMAGLGCDDVVVNEELLLFSGEQAICTVRGKEVRIETFTPQNFKKAARYLCRSGFAPSIATNKKTWMIIADTNQTNLRIAKALKAKYWTLCKGNSVNWKG